MNRFFKIVASILFAPFAIATGILVFGTLGLIAIPLSVQSFFTRRAWLREMQRSGRMRSMQDIVADASAGTLIVDRAGFGGKALYCWWTPDDIESLAPFAFPMPSLEERFEALEGMLDAASLPFDRWVYDRYLCDESGTAFLVAVRKGNEVAEEIRKQHGGLKRVETWSGLFSFETQSPPNQIESEFA